jgi:endonuclease/exonuclease/phosphatase family metal-dependent hydrolase
LKAAIRAEPKAPIDSSVAVRTLIVGDFNFTTQSKYFLAMTTGGVYPPGVFDPGWRRIAEAKAPARRIDYIWVRPGRDKSWLAVEKARTLFTEPVQSGNGKLVPLSDHCAVGATLRRSR